MSAPKVRIHLPMHPREERTVEIDGFAVPHVGQVGFRADTLEVPVVSLEIFADVDLEVEGIVEIVLENEKGERALFRLEKVEVLP